MSSPLCGVPTCGAPLLDHDSWDLGRCAPSCAATTDASRHAGLQAREITSRRKVGTRWEND